MIWGIYSALQGMGMPFPTPHRRKKQTIVTMAKPITSIAALTAQPLAALPPYGCGVPFTGGERLAGWQVME